MTKTIKRYGRRSIALLLFLTLIISLLPAPTMAAQVNSYHDPAEHWLTSSSRTNELDVNAVVTQETFYCGECRQSTSFTTWRTPEYTQDGVTAMRRNIKYSDGTCIDGKTSGVILDGTPGVDAYYTGSHWTKNCCNKCGNPNTNIDFIDYAYGKNVYWLYDCAAEFTEELDETVTYKYVDEQYHKKNTKSGTYCCFCYGTRSNTLSELERHNLKKTVIPQISNGRFAIVENCRDCSYERVSYTAAKSVITDYYGVVDERPHTITVSDLSEAGVTTQIRYGNSADTCTMTSAPNFTDEGQYTVYYEITYTYGGESMTENGVAYVWLRDENSACGCGCGKADCDCQDNNCGGNCCNNSCGDKHNFVLLEKIRPTCNTLGYSRYACVNCGKAEKRDYVNSLNHAWQEILIRQSTCETDGKILNVCRNCGEVKESKTLMGEHKYSTYDVEPTCINSGYTVKECEICGDRHITDIIPAKAHNYREIVTPAACESGGSTLHLCKGCGSSFVTDYTEPLGHKWDSGTEVTVATCDGEGVKEYRCVRCDYHRLEAVSAEGHTPDKDATCTDSQLCMNCGAVLKRALGHDYTSILIKPTCTEMGYTTYTCARCGDNYKGDYTEPTGHKVGNWIVDKEPTTDSEGKRHKECENCGAVTESESIKKLYTTATTDTHGEAVVGGYLVIVTDSDSKEPVANATVNLKKDNSIAVHLPNGRILDYADQSTITVLLVKDKTAVQGMQIYVTDKKDNYCSDKTNGKGYVTVPNQSDITNNDGKATVGWIDEDGNRLTVTVKVEDYESKRSIENAEVSIGKTGTISVILPDGENMDEKNRITITVTDPKGKPVKEQSIIVKNDLGNISSGRTDKDGKLTVPEIKKSEKHTAYIYGHTDGTFAPEQGMSRSEAAAVFARLLSAKNGDTVRESGITNTKYSDVPANAWYAGYVKYLTNYGVLYGYENHTFRANNKITRAEFTVMAVRFFEAYSDGNAEIVEKYTDFNDVSTGYWAAEYIKEAAAHGWINGYGDGSFKGESQITRAEVVTIVNRLLGRTADEKYITENIRRLNTFTDMYKKHWAYYDVMEAANAHTATFASDENWSK